MIPVNEYFEGKVKSLGLQTAEGRATVGVMAAGEYEFGTAQKEVMTITSGELNVRLPGEAAWRTFRKNESFTVAAEQKFQVKAAAPVSYLCLYL
jgi:purine/pyrimidine-nucleoside phosphorylase